MWQQKKIKAGVSGCLIDRHVRFDGGHKRSDLVTSLAGEGFELVSVCPEVVAGLPVPRQPIRPSDNPESPRVVYVRDA